MSTNLDHSAVQRIGIVTSTRAEYGLLRPILNAMSASRKLEPFLIVSGTHLSERHGMTVREIEADGQPIAARIPLPLVGNDALSVAKDMAAMTAGAAAAYSSLRLDGVLLLGDRTEILAAACAAVPCRLPIIHLEGGHRTAGAIDDSIRHAITKLASLHFTAADEYRTRLLQLGEAADRVFAVGSTGVDNLMAFGRSSRAAVAEGLGIDLEPGFLLVTYHPETLSRDSAAQQIRDFLDGLASVEDLKLLITMPNADAGADDVREALTLFASEKPRQVFLVESLGARGYAAALTACEAVVGNSSSGVIEAPAAGIPCVNVGGRQAGRLRTPNVIDCENSPTAIAGAIAQALDATFRQSALLPSLTFGDGRAAARIVGVLESTVLKGLENKPFIDLELAGSSRETEALAGTSAGDLRGSAS